MCNNKANKQNANKNKIIYIQFTSSLPVTTHSQLTQMYMLSSLFNLKYLQDHCSPVKTKHYNSQLKFSHTFLATTVIKQSFYKLLLRAERERNSPSERINLLQNEAQRGQPSASSCWGKGLNWQKKEQRNNDRRVEK